MHFPLRRAAVCAAVALTLALAGCGGKAAPAAAVNAAPAGGSAAPGSSSPATSAPVTGTSSTGNGASTGSTAASTAAAGAAAGNTSTSPCLAALPAKAPDGFTETGRSVEANKNASWTLKDSAGNSFVVSIVYKADAAAATKAVQITQTLYEKPEMTATTFNGCPAFARTATEGGKNDVRVIYSLGPEVVNMSATGPSASRQQLDNLGKGGQ